MSGFDVAIVGAGMAGASLAAELAPNMSVVMLEAEAQPGYHSTGRSAALWHETYGGPDVQPLTRASHAWLASPPERFATGNLLSPRGVIEIAREGDEAKLRAFAELYAQCGVHFLWLDREALARHCPDMHPEWTIGLHDPGCADIDVAAMHQACLRAAKYAGVELRCNAGLQSVKRIGDAWSIETQAGRVTASVLVNAAGAWADVVAEKAGAAPIGIAPYRRTMVQLRLDREIPRALPLMTDVDGQFYFKSDGAGGVWLSPHDEIACDPCDAAPEELDVAIAIDRFEQVVEWQVRQVTHKWAGLRSFAPDRLPVYGFDAAQPGFFWFAGQGGFGIQTAPAAAKIAASLIAGSAPDPMVAGIDPARYAPGRFT